MTDNKFISSLYEPNIPDFFENVLPELHEKRKEQQTNICNRLREIIKFDTVNKYCALKFNTIIPYIIDNIECSNITYKIENEHGYLEFKDNLSSIPFYNGISKPLLTDTLIQFEYDQYYPKLDTEGKLIGFAAHLAQKWSKFPDKLLVDEVESIIIKDNEIIVNGEVFTLESNQTNFITPIYDTLRDSLNGFVIDKYCIHFPETKLDFRQKMEYIFGKEQATFIKPNKVSFSLVKVEMIEQEYISRCYLPEPPKYPKIVDEAFWRKYCINFPESSFESYYKYLDAKQKMYENFKNEIWS
jgi:hypothetical protein